MDEAPVTLPPRLHQITLLLRSLDWYDLQPKSWTPELVRRQSKPGEGPSHRVECPACGGEGTHRVRGIDQPCEPCGGKWSGLTLKPGRGWVVVDAYTGRRVGTTETGLERSTRRVRCDACGGEGSVSAGRWRGANNKCERCSGAGTIEAVLFQRFAATLETAREHTGDPVIDAGIRRRKAGSYDELLLLLAELRVNDLDAYRAVAKIDETDKRTLQQLAYDQRAMRGLRFIVARMPDPIRVPSAVAAVERRQRQFEKREERREQRRREQAA